MSAADQPAPAATVDEILGLYARWGDERYDEEVSQASHAVQVASWARLAGAPDELVVAALLHDVGHLLAMARQGGGRPDHDVDLAHEVVGARWLGRLFPAEVTGPVALHVAAKRYRCATDPAEVDRLSPGSRASLVRQGGPMSPDEVARFEALPAAADALRLRDWDDAGKSLDADPLPVSAHRPLLLQVARRRSDDRE